MKKIVRQAKSKTKIARSKIQTQTVTRVNVATITNTMLAVAVLFLGASSFAASAMGFARNNEISLAAAATPNSNPTIALTAAKVPTGQYIKQLRLQLDYDLPMFTVTSSLAMANLPKQNFKPNSSLYYFEDLYSFANKQNNTFPKFTSSTVLKVDVTTGLPATSSLYYGYALVYNAFYGPDSDTAGAVKFKANVLDKGLVQWSKMRGYNFTLDQSQSNFGYITVYALTTNVDPTVATPTNFDLTYAIIKNQKRASFKFWSTDDASTKAKIITPNIAELDKPVQLGKWKITPGLSSENNVFYLKKVTFQLFDQNGELVTNAPELGKLSLHNSKNPYGALAESEFVSGAGNGYVTFTTNNKYPDFGYFYGPNETELVLKGIIKGGNAIKSNVIRNWGIRVTSPSGVEFANMSGSQKILNEDIYLGQAGIKNSPGTVFSSFYYLLHNSVPGILSQSTKSKLSPSDESNIFKFRIYNSGDSNLRIDRLAFKVNVAGLSNDNIIKNWKLFTAKDVSSSILGDQLASDSTCRLHGEKLVGCGARGGSPVPLVFDKSNQTKAAMDNLVIESGMNKEFILTADTTGIKSATNGNPVTINVVMDGETGFVPTSKTWAKGVVRYYYKPIGSPTELGPFDQSDSYDVIGPVVIIEN